MRVLVRGEVRGWVFARETTRRATNCFHSRGMKIIGRDKRDRDAEMRQGTDTVRGKNNANFRNDKFLAGDDRSRLRHTVTVRCVTGYSSLSDFGLALSRFFSRIYDDSFDTEADLTRA